MPRSISTGVTANFERQSLANPAVVGRGNLVVGIAGLK
jgi:hypothetical protein